jgi:hypothetical protein
MMVSRVDMKILDSPASTILVTNSEGARYDINGSFCFVTEIDTPERARLNGFGVLTGSPRTRAMEGLEAFGFGSFGNRVTRTGPGRAAKQLSFRMQPPEAATMRQAAVFVDVARNASCVPRGYARKD